MANGPIPYVIEELGAGGETVTLEGAEVPAGAPREKAGWQEGGDWKLGGSDEGVRFAGSKRVVYHLMYPVPFPRVLEGQLRDHFWGEPGRARRTRDTLLRIWERGRPVRCSWGGESFVGLLKKPSIDPEGLYDFRYSLTFLVSSTSTAPPKDRQQRPGPATGTSAADNVAEMRRLAAEQQARLEALRIKTTIRSTLVTAWNAVNATLATTAETIDNANAITFGAARDRADWLRCQGAAAKKVQDAAAALRASYNSFTFADFKVKDSASEQLRIERHSAESSDLLIQILAAMRNVRALMLAEIRQSQTLYRVQAGDTVDSIAQKQLGSRGRAQEIPQPLVPGKLLRLPAA